MPSTRTTPRRPGRPRNPVPRETMLAAARETFADRGYAGASMGEIADRVGLRKASLFHHFGSKEALYDEALAGTMADLGQLVAAVQMDAGDFLERLDRLGEQVTRYLGGNPVAARLLIRELVDGGPFTTRGGGDMIQATLAVVAAFLAAGMETGAIRPQDPLQLAWSIVGLHLMWFASPHVLVHALDGDIFEPGRIEARVQAILLQVRSLCGAREVTS